MNDALGRKRTLKLLAVIFIVGSLMTAVAPTYAFFLVSRVIVGFGFGAAGSVVPVYISEVAPANLRGRLVTFNQIAITLGISLAGQCARTAGNFLVLCAHGRVRFRLLLEIGARDKGQEPGADRVLLGTPALVGGYTNEWS